MRFRYSTSSSTQDEFDSLPRLPLTRLAFAWVNTPNMPLILGQTNFLMEFDVHFYRSRLEFEIDPKS